MCALRNWSVLLIGLLGALAVVPPHGHDAKLHSLTIGPTAAFQNGQRVMRREEALSGAQQIQVDDNADLDVKGAGSLADGADMLEIGRPVLRPVVNVIPESTESKFFSDAEGEGAGESVIDTACVPSVCPIGKLLKKSQELPQQCQDPNGCTSEECCVGTCHGFSCPAHTTLIAISSADNCDDYTCTEEQCCVGLCSMIHCPAHSKRKASEEMPDKCNAYLCQHEECCAGTCGGMSCPPDSVKMSSDKHPHMCDTLPCDAESCCQGQCSAEICTSGTLDKVLMPSNESDGQLCSGPTCTPEECCVGSCGDGRDVCTGTQPPLVADDMPSSCLGWNCTADDCCRDQCSAEICISNGTELKAEVMPCDGKLCTEVECCARVCSHAMCLHSEGLKLKTDTTEECATELCTKEECCDGFCRDSTCPAENGLQQKPAHHAIHTEMCETNVCTSEECCVGKCMAHHCPISEGLVMKNVSSMPSGCNGTTCKAAECCDSLATCDSVPVCPDPHVKMNSPPSFCNKTYCRQEECCAPQGACSSQGHVCNGRDNYVLKADFEVPASCVSDECQIHECCTKRRFIYWIEKTSGTIRRCRYDQCGHDDVELVKSGLNWPEGLLFDSWRGMLYWCDTDNGKIGRCNPELGCDATTELFVQHVGEPVRLALDEDHGFVYYVEHATNKVWRCSVNVVPCHSPELIVETTPRASVPYSIAIDPHDKMLYWTGHETLQRCDISRNDGGGFPCVPETVVGPLPALAGIVGIALDLKARKLYWSLSTKIEECPMKLGQTQANIKIVTQNVDQARGLAMDGVAGKLYMAEGISSGTISRIRTCPILNGIATCADTHILISGCTLSGCMNMPYDVALDWSPESVARETRALPGWATAAGVVATGNSTL